MTATLTSVVLGLFSALWLSGWIAMERGYDTLGGALVCAGVGILLGAATWRFARRKDG